MRCECKWNFCRWIKRIGIVLHQDKLIRHCRTCCFDTSNRIDGDDSFHPHRSMGDANIIMDSCLSKDNCSSAEWKVKSSVGSISIRIPCCLAHFARRMNRSKGENHCIAHGDCDTAWWECEPGIDNGMRCRESNTCCCKYVEQEDS